MSRRKEVRRRKDIQDMLEHLRSLGPGGVALADKPETAVRLNEGLDLLDSLIRQFGVEAPQQAAWVTWCATNADLFGLR